MEHSVQKNSTIFDSSAWLITERIGRISLCSEPRRNEDGKSRKQPRYVASDDKAIPVQDRETRLLLLLNATRQRPFHISFVSEVSDLGSRCETPIYFSSPQNFIDRTHSQGKHILATPPEHAAFANILAAFQCVRQTEMTICARVNRHCYHRICVPRYVTLVYSLKSWIY